MNATPLTTAELEVIRRFAWLTPEGVEIAIQELGVDRRDVAASLVAA